MIKEKINSTKRALYSPLASTMSLYYEKRHLLEQVNSDGAETPLEKLRKFSGNWILIEDKIVRI